MSDATLESQSFVDELLSGVVAAAANMDEAFVALQVSKPITVDQEDGKISRLLDLRRSESAVRARGAAVAERTYRNSPVSYSCDWYSVGIPVDYRQNRSAYDKFEIASLAALDDIRIQTEMSFKTVAFNAANWDTSIAGHAANKTGQGWDDYTNSHPIADIADAATTVQVKCGVRPNVGVCGRELFEVLREHPDVSSKTLYTTGGKVTSQQVAAALGLDKLVVSDAVGDHSTGSNSVDGYACIGGEDFLLVSQHDGRPDKSAMATIAFDPNGEGVFSTHVIPDPLKRRDLIEVDCYLDFVIVEPLMGCLFTGQLEA